MLAAAFENASSDNPEHWSNAAATCRRLLKAAADALRPPGPDVNGRKMGDDNYVNRLVDWIVNQSESDTAAKLIASDLEDLGRRLDAGRGGWKQGCTRISRSLRRLAVPDRDLSSARRHPSPSEGTASSEGYGWRCGCFAAERCGARRCPGLHRPSKSVKSPPRRCAAGWAPASQRTRSSSTCRSSLRGIVPPGVATRCAVPTLTPSSAASCRRVHPRPAICAAAASEVTGARSARSSALR